MDLSALAVRIAATSIEAARKKKPKKSKKPARVSKPREEVEPSIEYSCQLELMVGADFEGNTSKRDLTKALRSEITKAVDGALATIARAHSLKVTKSSVRPLGLEIAILDSED